MLSISETFSHHVKAVKKISCLNFSVIKEQKYKKENKCKHKQIYINTKYNTNI